MKTVAPPSPKSCSPVSGLAERPAAHHPHPRGEHMRYRWDPMFPSSGRRSSSYADPLLRASDAERNDVTERLSRHFTDGRLDQSEFKARLDRTMGATTRGDLEGLFDDLPHLTTE